MVNMYYQMLRGKTMPHLYIPRRENRAMVIPVKQQPPADAGRRQFCVEIDVGWACLDDMVIGKDEEKRAPKYPLRSSWRISEIQSILFRIFVPTEENSDIDLQGDNIDFVPFLWYKDNNGCDVTILSTLWFNNQEGVDNIVLAPLGQGGVVFVDIAYTVTKRGLKLTLVMEMEVQREKAVKDIMNSFLKMPMLQDNQMQNDDHNELDSSGSPSETATLSKKCANLLADIEKCSDDNSQIVTQQLDELSNSCGEDAAGQYCQAPGDNQETPADANVGGEEMPADLATEKSLPELSKEVQCIMQILREQQQIRDDYERETAELKQKLEVLHHEAAMLSLQQRQALETIAKDEHDSEFSEETKGETSGGTVDRHSAHTPPIQDSDAHNYKDQEMLEFENHLQRRAHRTASQVGVHCPHPVEASGVWKGKPPSPALIDTPYVKTLIHYKQTRSTFNIHLGHCHTCNKTIEALLHSSKCGEDRCATCLQIAREVAQHIARCTRGTRCLLRICAANVPLGLNEYGTVHVTPVFVGLVRLYLWRTFCRG
ncbi:uncharacterized protein LOC118415020 isoform X2 [Branchiostoma floridae]|uniref:Uncharacterized protein LOC118415020 isoform X2 n=1 Tax=Branchiostoma floridae TaxID=7739 RepID=A0A9J7L4A6_BRAFL|nr:uncharacterized protein LOC118415020 isoform X2 [Branchiostoma floridae]